MQINKDKIYGLGVTLISVLLTCQAFRYPPESSQFPRFLCILMVVFSLISLVRAIKNSEPKKEEVSFAQNFKIPCIVFATAIAYGLGIAKIGYFVSTIAYLLVTMYIFGARRIVPMVVSSAIFLIVIYALFVQFLGLRLPEGIFF